jgi:very-short-patch-repair endonuclease
MSSAADSQRPLSPSPYGERVRVRGGHRHALATARATPVWLELSKWPPLTPTLSPSKRGEGEKEYSMRRSQPWKTQRARVLRANASSAEDKLWAELRNRQLGGLKFVRQAAIGPYFVDFLCRECAVVVEVDGGTHSTDDEIAADGQRAAYLLDEGHRIFRVHNSEIYENVDGVCDSLLAYIAGETAHD